jgi:hypothetical protein
MERAVAPKCSLHFLHQNSKLLSILPGDEVIGRYGDRTVVVIRHDGQIERVIERGFFDLGFSGEVDRESMPEGQHAECYNSRSSKGEIDAGVCYSGSPENCSKRHAALPQHYQEGVHPSAHSSGHYALSSHPKLGTRQRPRHASECRRYHQSRHWRITAIEERTATIIAIEIEMIAFVETRCLRYGKTNTAPANEPTPTQAKIRPSWEGEQAQFLSAITGKSAGMTEITTEKSTFRKRIIFMRFELRAYRSELMNDSVKFSRSLVAAACRGFHCIMTRATPRNASALIEMSSGAPRSGISKPPRAGPTILERLSCTPSQRDRRRQFLFTDDVRNNGFPNWGAKGEPNSQRKDARKHSAGVEHVRPRSKGKDH